MPRIAMSYRATGRFSPLVLDYLEGVDALRPFHGFTPDLEGLQAAISERTFPLERRRTLVQVLEQQYAGMDMRPEVRRNLDLLAAPNTLTVTTGHQLCLFTGPLYVVFKVLNAVRLAQRLSTLQRAVVPVFWLASEDHDRAEIDHAWVAGTRVQWPGATGGAVGRMPLEGIGPVLRQAGELLGPGSHADELRALLHRCYREDHDLARATRLFADALFGRFGVLVLDADDPRLKRSFAPVMQEELLNQVAVRCVRHAEARMDGHWRSQAHARDINLFHLRPGHRSRIEKQEARWQVLDGGPAFTLDQLLAELDQRPEAFSPNVLLRPLYQECILPNVAYVGGGGELAYWMQLKWLFQAVQLPMPVLMLRTSAAFLGAKDLARAKALGLSVPDLFRPAEELRAQVARAGAGFPLELGPDKERMATYYAGLAGMAAAADPTLKGAVEAMAARARRDVERLEQKLLRAAKRRQQEPLDRLGHVLEGLFPGGGLQERRDNFMPWYAQEGPAFLDRLLRELDPLEPAFSVLVEA